MAVDFLDSLKHRDRCFFVSLMTISYKKINPSIATTTMPTIP